MEGFLLLLSTLLCRCCRCISIALQLQPTMKMTLKVNGGRKHKWNGNGWADRRTDAVMRNNTAKKLAAMNEVKVRRNIQSDR
jgi:hypothetical protein